MSESGWETCTGHCVTHFATRLRTRLDDLVDAPTWSMTKDDKQQTLRDLAVATAQLEALRLRVLVDAERDGDVIDPADRTVADWGGARDPSDPGVRSRGPEARDGAG